MSRLDDTILDINYILDILKSYRSIVQSGSCNSCKNNKRDLCKYLPDWGDPVRYNCPFYENRM